MNEDLSPEQQSLLRAGFATRDAVPPLPPVEPLLAKWLARHPANQVVAFPGAPEPLALAARSGERLSPETLARLGALVGEMNSEPPPPPDGR